MRIDSKPHRNLVVWVVFFFVFSPAVSVLGAEGETTSAAQDSSDVTTAMKNYPILRIGPGDLISIFVYGESVVSSNDSGFGLNDDLPTDYEVDSDGIIEFPFLGRVQLDGLTPVEASEKIARLLSKPRKVSVLIKKSNTYWVSILGNVAKPGRYQIMGKPTLLSALAEAGGPLPGTDMGGAILIHNDYKTNVDLDKYLTGTGKMDIEPYLYPGDTLMVQKSGWPDLGTIAIVASILASTAVLAVELNNIRH